MTASIEPCLRPASRGAQTLHSAATAPESKAIAEDLLPLGCHCPESKAPAEDLPLSWPFFHHLPDSLTLPPGIPEVQPPVPPFLPPLPSASFPTDSSASLAYLQFVPPLKTSSYIATESMASGASLENGCLVIKKHNPKFLAKCFS